MQSTRIDAAQFLKEAFADHRVVVEETALIVTDAFVKLADLCTQSLLSGGKILLFGNGGSAADAQHLAAELVVRFNGKRNALAAIALTTDTSILTAAGNDLGFDQIFARQVAALARPGDLAIGISTSGLSPNIIAALEAARVNGCGTVSLTGQNSSELDRVSDLVLAVPSSNTARIQEIHGLIGHALCAVLDERFSIASGR